MRQRGGAHAPRETAPRGRGHADVPEVTPTRAASWTLKCGPRVRGSRTRRGIRPFLARPGAPNSRRSRNCEQLPQSLTWGERMCSGTDLPHPCPAPSSIRVPVSAPKPACWRRIWDTDCKKWDTMRGKWDTVELELELEPELALERGRGWAEGMRGMRRIRRRRGPGRSGSTPARRHAPSMRCSGRSRHRGPPSSRT